MKLNLLEAGCFYRPLKESLPREKVEEIERFFQMPIWGIVLSWSDLIKFEIDPEDCERLSDYDELQQEEAWDDYIISDASGYLSYARKITWDKKDGYKISATRAEAFSRSYDAELIPEAVSPDRKVLVCREYNHDCPTGATVIMAALDKEEMEYLEYRSFPDIQKWVSEKEAQV